MSQQSRRQFLQTTAATAALASGLHANGAPLQESKNPLEKLNIACIGTANRALADVQGVMTDNIVAVCDVDANYLEKSRRCSPKRKAWSLPLSLTIAR